MSADHKPLTWFLETWYASMIETDQKPQGGDDRE